jgi:hypothetical protein
MRLEEEAKGNPSASLSRITNHMMRRPLCLGLTKSNYDLSGDGMLLSLEGKKDIYVYIYVDMKKILICAAYLDNHS